MFLQKLRSFSFPSNPKITRDDDKKHHRRRKSLRTPNSEHRNPLSPSTTNSTKDSHTSQRKTNICAEATDIIKENNGEEENQEGRDFREYLEKCRKAEEAEERKRKKMAEKRKEVNLSPWARRM
ncbi:hypothetical protein sscle_07g056890 [Sclerotinia sclerotiorum 1980 UF-70]|uniref:Uncharacterized protein n=1 Tax=Sclerotinia sclerotiorum (strain ATCC 18683 / 1980 / Ss-1) TaxID=665079 RepID=A0A1D9Q7P2_SCLS1|nr:hypothetical protein sscle_07g056890 [Sclerotinia sclerotiorum 1980 UF-70]